MSTRSAVVARGADRVSVRGGGGGEGELGVELIGISIRVTSSELISGRPYWTS